MNAFTVLAVAASLAFTSAQLTSNLATNPGSVAVGPLEAMSGSMQNNPMGGQQNGMGSGMGTGMNQGMNQGMGAMGSGSNSFLPYAMMSGSDSAMRMAMMPAMSRLGSVPQYYFMRSGMDKMMQSYGANMMANMLSQSGVNPMMATIMSGKMMDAPDGYTMMNMLLNRNGMTGANNGMGMGMGGNMAADPSQQNMPQGAAAGNNQQAGNSGMGGLFSNPMTTAMLFGGMF